MIRRTLDWPSAPRGGSLDGVTDGIWERDDYEQDQDGIINPEDELAEDGMDQVLEQGYSPPERPVALDKFGTTLAEERQGETLDQRLAEEEPDPNMEVEPRRGRAGDPRGRGRRRARRHRLRLG